MRGSLPDRLYRRELYSPQGRSARFRGIYADRDWIKDLDIVNELDGHSGCVNALSWSKSGRLLASGSDDQHLNIHTFQPEDSTSQFFLTTTVATGHTQNIFSVKFMPHSNDRTLITAAGDGEVRIFDLEHSGQSREASAAASQASAGRRRNRHNIYHGVRYLSDGDTNSRVYRSHGDRVKRIVTESSPHLFLTCSEDGDVRQWDLRQPSSAYPHPSSGSVPPPLISYKRYHLDINTISCSQNQPHYIALGGAHLHCFLHDRRMLGRDRESERAAASSSANGMSEADEELMGRATQCVRKFAPGGQSRMRRTDNGHITACKISDANPNEMVVSWSGEHIYSFDLVRSPDAREAGHVRPPVQSSGGHKVRESKERKRKRKEEGRRSLSSLGTERAPSRQRTDELASDEHADDGMALRVQYENGQTEDIPINSPARAHREARDPVSALRESVLTDSQRVSYRLAKALVKVRQDMFTLGTPRDTTTSDPTGHATSFTTVLGYSASVLPEMNEVSRSWRYPVDPSEADVAMQRTLRSHRDSAVRFVQAAGVIARALGGQLRTASAASPSLGLFQSIAFPPHEGPDLPPSEHFCYDFIKAVLLWLDSGVGALLDGFTNSAESPRHSARLPVPNDAGAEAVDEILIPYLLRLASKTPIVNVDASRFEIDQNRIVYKTEQDAVHAFAAAVKVPFADLSSAVASSSIPGADTSSGSPEAAQDRRAALQHWGLKVARGVLMNAGEGVNFALVDRAFGGLGRPDGGIAEEEAHERLQQEEVDTDEAEDVVRSVGVRRANEGDSQQSADDDGDMIPVSEVMATIQDMEEEEENGEDDEEDVDEDEDTSENGNHNAGDDDDDDDDDPDDENADYGLPSFVYRSAFERRRLRERVEEHVPCIPHTRVFRGHCNVKTVKDVNFFGLEDEYVVSGSDDGNLFIWDRKTGQLLNILEGDGEVVNVVQGHPYEPMLAVSGIDNTIKIFSPDARAREAARLGRGIAAADPSAFPSIAWPARIRGRRVPRQGESTAGSMSSSEPAVAAAEQAEVARAEEDEAYVAPGGLASRKRMHLEYQITSQNDVERQGGNQDAFITRSMLAQLAQTIRRRRGGGGDGGEGEGEAGEEETDGLGGLGGRVMVGDDCTVM